MNTIPNPTAHTSLSFDNTEVAFSYKSDQDLRKSYWLFKSINAPWLTEIGTKVVKFALKVKLPIQPILKKTIFEQFCGGETIDSCHPTISRLAQYGVQTILDYSVEGEKSIVGFDEARDEILRTIEAAHHSPHLPFSVFKVSGIADANLLAKIQRDESLSAEDTAAYERIKKRIHTLCRAATKAGTRILIDGEESWTQGTIDELAEEMMQTYNRERAVVYNTYQMYRHDMLNNLQEALQRATTYEYFLGAKLVRGAYMEKERERAEELGYPDPIQPDKEATDNDYNRALLFCVENKERISLVAGTHNEYSTRYLTQLMEEYGIATDDPRVYFSQLYGMSDNISFNLAQAGYKVAKYVPYGPVAKVMPYLFRRAEENTSVKGQSSRELRLVRDELRRRKLH